MAKFEQVIERSIFRKVAGFFRNSSKTIAHDAARPPIPGSFVHEAGGTPSTRLFAIYGDRLRITGSGPLVQQYLSDLECLPDSFHNKLLGYFAGHPKGGIDIIDGPVTNLLTDLRGAAPRGWSSGKTWDEVPGALDPSTNRVIIGTEGKHGCVSLALHEAGHAVDAALGRESDSVGFQQLHTLMDTKAPYFTQPGAAGREETFAEGLAAWAKNRHLSPDDRAIAIGDALELRGYKQIQGTAFDNYFLDIQHSLEPRPL
ncbi:anthrax toxin lethal factor-related metalloendopeptidase [Actinoallomurus iriomotensis]|uniref:Anthrax toxin lethal/endema factor N-/C-terminal domain-containing protein n=1 Tax=Actinoallomurus iriomotensis TaxID=478107 RepID=A0A9W6SBR7_9ACTN|nr:hypothetical protein [Actinoallomurus iriomotensis]GLY90979.1 hypothetical protein Airi02_089080 [Actinoallomurus iriomotensis]